jgi:hypothetical protein
MGAKKDIRIYQGSTFEMTVNWKDANNDPIDTTGFTGAMKIKPTYNTSNTLATANVSVATDGVISILIPASNTAVIPVANATSGPARSTYVYDLKLTSGDGTVTTLLWGQAIVQASVT